MNEQLTQAKRAIANAVDGIENRAKVHGGVERFRPYLLELARAMDLIDAVIREGRRVETVTDKRNAEQIRTWINGGKA